ncbi:MAG: sodium:solute symporter family protein [Pirellulaceae bacterium]|nr:sodium:solute symporter family protein [Pirellulaceae bacterium]
MLAICIVLYLLFTISLGLVAAGRVHGARDFMVAGRSLPLMMGFTCVFATWFGAETVLSVSATFANQGLQAIPGDPFGFSMCLLLVAVFFAKYFYRMDLLTIGDFYHKRFGKSVELFTSIAITLSYLGWTAAQLTALGIVLSVLGQGVGQEWMTINNCIVLGAVVVMIYTVLGGMWSVALTDLIQTFVIIVGLIVVAVLLAGQAGGVNHVVHVAREQGRLQLFPSGGWQPWLVFVTGFITAALGSIPQQDVFQRVTSAKDERTAVRATFLGGAFYFVFAFVPMFIAFSAVVIDANYAQLFASEDERAVQRILPQLILDRTPFWAQVLFLGALLSAIMSTASGTLLAPSSLFTENVLRPLIPSINEKNMLWILRTTLILFAIGATYQAYTSNQTMYEMVQAAYSVTLVGAFVPLVAGIYWRRATTQGALCSIAAGIATWGLLLLLNRGAAELADTEAASAVAMIPPQLAGLVASLLGMIAASLAPQWIRDTSQAIAIRDA